MPCDTVLKPQQTKQERRAEIRKTIMEWSAGLASGRVKAKVGPQGALTFLGLTETERAGVTDVCAYRHIMIFGTALAKQAIARAEALAGRSVNRQVVATGVHSHDGGQTWHDKD